MQSLVANTDSELSDFPVNNNFTLTKFFQKCHYIIIPVPILLISEDKQKTLMGIEKAKF